MTSSHAANSGTPSWLAPVALVIAVISVGLAVWALVQGSGGQSSTSDKPYSAEESAAAKTKACAAFTVVRTAVTLQTNADLGPDPIAKEAVAGNARLAILGGGGYLLNRVDPATPTELGDAIKAFANNLQDIGMNQLQNVPNTDPALSGKLNDAQTSSQKLTEMCK